MYADTACRVGIGSPSLLHQSYAVRMFYWGRREADGYRTVVVMKCFFELIWYTDNVFLSKAVWPRHGVVCLSRWDVGQFIDVHTSDHGSSRFWAVQLSFLGSSIIQGFSYF